MTPLTGWLVDLVARVPTRVQTKLLAAFLAIAALLVMAGAVGLQVLRGVNERTEELIHLQRKIEAYRQVQHDTTSQLYSVSSALLSSDDSTLSSTLRRLNQFGYDADRLQFVAKDEVDLLAEFQQQYGRFVDIVTHVVELIRAGRAGEARELQVTQATPLADRLERLTNHLVNKAEADMVAGIEARTQAYETARWIVIAFALGSIALALGLGYAISWSLVGPVKEIEAKLNKVATGDFTQRVEVANRDELGALAADVNRMSEELGRLYQQLELASKHKSQFLANMSHELRTPLNAILGYAELMVDGIYGEPSEKMRGVLERLQSNGRHLLGLINAVLDLSKIEAGQLTLSVNDYSLKEVVQSAFVAVESLATAKRLALKIELPAALPTGRGDEQRITQVLLNLVGNAIKFTEAGEVAIAASAENGAFTVAVRDTGPGIAVADQTRIFEEFQQADNSSTRSKGGTGLGLAISKRIIEMHGGRIWVESNQGEGSTFAFRLPIKVEAKTGQA
jgi:signal transduction histidine kinase